MNTEGRHVGLTGLATMGQNLARNIARNGFPIAVHNRTTEKTERFVENFAGEGDIVGALSAKDLVVSLERPRAIFIMVKAGQPVDDVIGELAPMLDDGDLLIDGGNSLYLDSERRARELQEQGLRFLGCGVSGGEEGALHGPSIMPGGSRPAYEQVEDVLTAIAAKVDGKPCCSYVGDGGAGHYVKMVHNGIEYADMQLIAEAYDLLHSGAGMNNDELAAVFAEWNKGELDSFLIDITARILRTRDDQDPSAWLVDKVLDRAEQKGTGRWTAKSALDLGVPATVITEAVFARAISSLKDQRVNAARVLDGPDGRLPEGDDFVGAVHSALLASKIVAYAQGFEQLTAAAAEHEWNLDLGAIAALWRGGCIIRARFLERITEAYDAATVPQNLMMAPYFARTLGAQQDDWRRVVATAATSGIGATAFSSALAYYDSYRREQLPANLIQAQRDLFGAHTYERNDRPGTFHSAWH